MRKINFKVLIVFLIFVLSTSFVSAITIESKKQEMKPDENKGYFTGDVKVQVGDVVVTSPRADLDLEPATKKPSIATFFDKPYAIQVKDNKKHEVKADIIKVSLIKKIVTAQGNAQTNVLEDSKPTVIITSDTQEYDTNTHLMTALGSVVVNYEDVIASSDRAYALMDKDGGVQNLKLASRATIKQDKSIVRGDEIVYSKQKQDITATGNTHSDITFENGDRVIVDARSQQYSRIGNTIMASGKVHVVYGDYTADGPKAIVHMDSKTNKAKKIIFIGRSKIVEKGSNSVEADKITMTMEPRKFEAVGHVVTNIEKSNDNEKDEMEFSL